MSLAGYFCFVKRCPHDAGARPCFNSFEIFKVCSDADARI